MNVLWAILVEMEPARTWLEVSSAPVRRDLSLVQWWLVKVSLLNTEEFVTCSGLGDNSWLITILNMKYQLGMCRIKNTWAWWAVPPFLLCVASSPQGVSGKDMGGSWPKLHCRSCSALGGVSLLLMFGYNLCLVYCLLYSISSSFSFSSCMLPFFFFSFPFSIYRNICTLR